MPLESSFSDFVKPRGRQCLGDLANWSIFWEPRGLARVAG